MTRDVPIIFNGVLRKEGVLSKERVANKATSKFKIFSVPVFSFPLFFSHKPIFRKNMLGFTTAIPLPTLTPISIPSAVNSPPILPLITNPKPPSPPLKFQSHRNPKKPRKFAIYAENGSGPITDPNEREKKVDEGTNKNGGGGVGGGGGEEEVKRNGWPRFNLRWADLVLDPDPDNIVAVGLTGLLAWASAQVLWQLFFISLAILVAALKYSFIAALLIFILITLL
ncbi:uncharacterized protein LOC130759379 [Actinidia eriantha]|uniref:uncharacterized protein LOC130759379 n=1 Tax=Actinidia eriantha TaxID=165200 RepID=UPI00258CEEB5|nr:uncharacterized protein LOC130759379 [Actinidia eriantha]